MRFRGSENFVRLGRSGNLGHREVWKDWEGERFGRLFSPVINVFLELHVDCLCYISIDYRTENLVDSITIVQIHINISTYIYYCVVHHVRILHKSISGTRTQPLCFHDGMRGIGRAEMLGGYEGRKVWEVRKVKMCERLGWSEILEGYGLRKFLVVR
jgi:hypothetical protein